MGNISVRVLKTSGTCGQLDKDSVIEILEAFYCASKLVRHLFSNPSTRWIVDSLHGRNRIHGSHVCFPFCGFLDYDIAGQHHPDFVFCVANVTQGLA